MYNLTGYNLTGFINIGILIFLVILISIYGLDIREPYPPKLIKLFSEPYIRFLSYIGIYAMSFYNSSITFVLLFAVLLLHIDYVNLAT